MSRRRRRRGAAVEAAAGGHERWLVSYGDFVTLLFAFFTTMYAISTVDKAKAENLEKSMVGALKLPAAAPTPAVAGGAPFAVPHAVLPEAPPPSEPPLSNLIAELQSAAAMPGLRGRMQVLPDAAGVTLTLGEAGFFATGRAEIRDDALGALDALAARLRAHDDREPLSLTVAGHTDDRPLRGGRFHNNLELSAARATFIAARLIEAHDMTAARISAAGYGEWRPVADNASPEGRARNRRVEIRVELAPSRPTNEEIR